MGNQYDIQKKTYSNFGPGYFYGVSQARGRRMYMEDTHIDRPNLSGKNSLFAIFDGHGGADVSTFAERHFADELLKNQSYQKGDYETALKQTFVRIDSLLLAEEGKKQMASIHKMLALDRNGYQDDNSEIVGSTANVILITPDFHYCANAGDSRSVCCLRGEAKELNKEHGPNDPIESNRIRQVGGEIVYGRVNGGLNVSRAFGSFSYKSVNLKPEEQMITPCPDVLKIKNKDIDYIIMGCDGIWEVKSNADMVSWISERLAKSISPQKILSELLDSLISFDNTKDLGMDNMTAILIKFDKNK